jgi:hypothetical protein
MKLTVALIAVLLFVGIPAATALDRPGIVRVTTRTLYTTPTVAGPLRVSSIYNLNLSPRPIGNGQMLCVPTDGARGPLPAGSRYCFGSFTIGGNTIAVHGVARNEYRYQLVVVGGTGQYDNVGGTLTVYRITRHPLRERLVFNLTT